MSEVQTLDLETTKEPIKKRTVSPKKTNEDHSETLEDNFKANSETVSKPIKVGIRNLATVLSKRMEKDAIKEVIKNLDNKGSDIAPMYFLDDLIEPLELSSNEINRIKGLVNNPKSKRLTIKQKIENGIMIKTKESLIISNKAKIDALLEANRVLRADIKALKGN